MCGLIGVSQPGVDVQESCNRLQRRGPDSHDTYTDDQVSFAHTRLSIIDLSTDGAQPMHTGRYIIVYNGEIYNYKELRGRLDDYDYQSETDTEMIVYAYHEWGEKCLDEFNGQFAFCIYDTEENEFFLARDRYGIKPLYHHNHDDTFTFASEIKAITPLLDDVTVNEDAFKEFLTMRFTTGDKTMVDDVNAFKPGHYMRYDLEDQRITEYDQYYELDDQPKRGYYDAIEHTREAVEESVRKRMVADVPVASLLSGGLDSSIVTALAKEHNDDLHTYSIGFDTTNELPQAKRVADALNTEHHEYTLPKEDVSDYVDDMIYRMDEPIGDPGFLPIYVLSEKVSEDYKVVLSGDGADEVFTGYDRYKLYYYGRFLRHLAIYDFDNDILSRLKAMRGKDTCDAFLSGIRLFQDDELKELGVTPSLPREQWRDYTYDLDSAQAFDINTLLPNDFFMKADKMSASFGLEQRVPFMDHDVVHAGFQTKPRHRLWGWDEKHVLRRAFKDRLPKPVVERDKHGFDVPIDHWFKHGLGDELRRLLNEQRHDLYNADYAKQLLDELQGRGDNYAQNFLLAQKLWSLYVFEKWHKEYIA